MLENMSNQILLAFIAAVSLASSIHAATNLKLLTPTTNIAEQLCKQDDKLKLDDDWIGTKWDASKLFLIPREQKHQIYKLKVSAAADNAPITTRVFFIEYVFHCGTPPSVIAARFYPMTHSDKVKQDGGMMPWSTVGQVINWDGQKFSVMFRQGDLTPRINTLEK